MKHIQIAFFFACSHVVCAQQFDVAYNFNQNGSSVLVCGSDSASLDADAGAMAAFVEAEPATFSNITACPDSLLPALFTDGWSTDNVWDTTNYVMFTLKPREGRILSLDSMTFDEKGKTWAGSPTVLAVTFMTDDDPNTFGFVSGWQVLGTTVHCLNETYWWPVVATNNLKVKITGWGTPLGTLTGVTIDNVHFHGHVDISTSVEPVLDLTPDQKIMRVLSLSLGQEVPLSDWQQGLNPSVASGFYVVTYEGGLVKKVSIVRM